MGGAAKTVGRVGSGVFTLGGSEIARNNLPKRSVGNQILNAPGTILTGGQYNPGYIPGLGTAGQDNPGQYTSGPFSIDPAQIAADQKAINDLGAQQEQTTLNFNTNDQAAREASRTKLADLLTQQAQQSFARTLPGTAEDYNAGHLLNSSGYGNEVARQQGYLASDIANKLGQVGLEDINRSSDIGLQASLARQGLGQSALSRGFSLNDFVNQANVAKSIGAQAAPQVGNGKGQTGTLLSGVGSLAPLVGAARGYGKGGPAGAVVGAGAGLAGAH